MRAVDMSNQLRKTSLKPSAWFLYDPVDSEETSFFAALINLSTAVFMFHGEGVGNVHPTSVSGQLT